MTVLPCLGKEPVLVLSAGIDCATSSHSCLHLQQHGFIFNSPLHMKKNQSFDPWKYLKELGQFWFMHNSIRMHKNTPEPKAQTPLL